MWKIGCALWSLRAPDTIGALRRARELGFACVQFAFGRATDLSPDGLEAIRAALDRTGLEVPAGMVAFAGEDYSTIDAIRRTGGFVPADLFPARLEHCRRTAEALARLGVTHVTTHAGFIPEPADPAYREVLDRTGRAADALHAAGLTVALETGQESSRVLLRALDDLGRDFLSVNFDPANLILYGTEEPVEAARALARRVTGMHAKDAAWAPEPGRAWGAEVPLGKGAVDFRAVLAALGRGGFAGPIIIEREAGTDRSADLVASRRYLEAVLAEGAAG